MASLESRVIAFLISGGIHGKRVVQMQTSIQAASCIIVTDKDHGWLKIT